MRKLPFIFVILSMVLCTCIKPPQYSNIPEIAFKMVAFDTLKSGESDSIVITFKDGDGDLGSDKTSDSLVDSNLCKTYEVVAFFDTACATFPQAFNLFSLDSRANNNIRCMKLSQIPIIPSKGSSKAISGDISFQTFPLTPIPGRTVDSLSYYIMIRDQAGHCSNVIRTSTIYITQ